MKKLKYLTIFTFILGLCTVSCNDDFISPLGTGGGDEDDDPIIIGGGGDEDEDEASGSTVYLDSLDVNN